MEKIRQFWTLTNSDVRRYTEYVQDKGIYSVIHNHVMQEGCWGECPIYNMPDDVRAELDAAL